MLEKVIKIFAEVLEADAGAINESTDIAEDLGADSIDVVEAIMGIEDETGISIPDDEIPDFKCIGDIVKYLEDNKN